MSKVTVEYHDPAGVFPLVSSEIASRLPLRNLNWQSPPRPLRQIKSLHLEFVPDKDTQAQRQPSISQEGSEGPNSLDIVRGGPDTKRHAVKERRHQIPGFRTSPYLKVYVLRCDDKDRYSERERRKIREWIRANAHPESKRDEHDAFEWLILHVVIPDTVAASEPRWRESAKDPDELKERKGGNKLIGKGNRTVFDRLRADFNDTGKSKHDRVAQIRLPKDKVPADLLPTPAVAPTLEESAQERENAWNDLISKFKTSILGPFDRRVRQYEADIAEQESRRALPGWNFCTFFIHKEGLAKALESIGLVEDALAIYDELALGLEAVLRDIAAEQALGTATSFAAYTDDIKDRIAGLTGNYTNGTNEMTTDEERDAAMLFRKDFRESIVMSSISVFDFFCYIFSRQKALILRLANARSIRIQLGADASREGGEDLVLTSEVCWRASSFIHNSARTLRQDLSSRAAAAHSALSEVEIESLVCSWAWAVAGQILEETAVPALLDITRHGRREPSHLVNGSLKRPAMSIGLGANQHPQRTTSLPAQSVQTSEAQRPRSEERFQGDNVMRSISSSGQETNKPVGIPGQAELATYRAELISMRRKMLEQLASRKGWYAGWAAAHHARGTRMQDFTLSHVPRDSVLDGKDPSDDSRIMSPGLRSALESENAFQATFTELTNSTVRHYFTATQSKSTETLLGDLAVLKCQQGDFEAAMPYFQHILPLLPRDDWSMMRFEALKAFATCLKHLERCEEYVQNALELLAMVVLKRTQKDASDWDIPGKPKGKIDALGVAGVLADVISVSEELRQKIVRPLKSFFADVSLERQIRHSEHIDAFHLTLQVRHALDEDLTVDEVGARLIGLDDSTQEITMSSREPVTLKPGLNILQLTAHTVAYGPFLIDRIEVNVKGLSFIEELRPPPKPTPLGFTEIEPPTVTVTEAQKLPAFVFLYPAEEAFSVEIRRSKTIHIDKPRTLDLCINTGRNVVEAAEVRLKPTSAGLRLHLADATCAGVERDSDAPFKPGQITCKDISCGSDATIVVPYTVEHVNADITVRLEINYRTAQGVFTALKSATVSNELPLDVEVKDNFNLDTLYSNFTVRTTAATPFTVRGARLDDSPVYSVETPPVLPLPMTVYRTQPLNLFFKIRRKPAADGTTLKRDAALALAVQYQALDDVALSLIRKTFVRDVKASDFHALVWLFTPILLERSRPFVKGSELELAALFGQLRLPAFDVLGWEEILATLHEDVRMPAATWLRQWHNDHVCLEIAPDSYAEMPPEQLTISVDIPNVDMVFSTSLKLQIINDPVNSAPPTLVMGVPIQATVHVKHNRDWSAKKIFPSVPTFKIHGDDENQQTFVCDVGAEPDTWLTGGPRRSHFIAKDSAEQSFPIVLVPVKSGIHRLPQVAIQQAASDPDVVHDQLGETSLLCESHYEDAARIVHVIRDLRTTRVQIVESPASVALPPSRPGTASTRDAG